LVDLEVEIELMQHRFLYRSQADDSRYAQRVRCFAALVALIAVSAAGAAPLRAHLTLVARNPLTVSGSSFRPSERVTLRVTGDVRAVARARASARGTFKVQLNVVLHRCTAAAVQAVGTAGSRAALKLLPVSGCLPE